MSKNSNKENIQDLFKICRLFEIAASDKSGIISEHLEKSLNKKIIKIIYSNGSNPFITLPRNQAMMKSLGLSSSVLYIEYQIISESQLSFHFELMNPSKNSSYITISTIFPQTKKINNNNVQISIPLTKKWTVLCIQIDELIDKFLLTQKEKGELTIKSVKISGNILLKAIFGSNFLYNYKTLPKDFSFKKPNNLEWPQFIDWIKLPLQENEVFEILEQKTVSEPIKSPIRENCGGPLEDIDIQPQDNQFLDEIQDISQSFKNGDGINSNPSEQKLNENSIKFENSLVYGKSFVETKQVLQKDKQNPLKLALKKIIPFTGRDCKDIILIKIKGKLKIVFASYNLVILLNPVSTKQKFIFSTGTIIRLFLCKGKLFIINSQNEISLCDIYNRKILIQFCLPLSTFNGFDESVNSQFLIVAGKDQLKRDCILVLDNKVLETKQQIVVLHRQLSDFDIQVIKASLKKSSLFLTCGSDNLRQWKIMPNSLKQKSFNSGPRTDKKIFNDIYFLEDDLNSLIFAVTEGGQLYKFSLSNHNLEKIFQIHNGPISSIFFSSNIGFCTAGLDRVVSLWNKEFSDCIVSFETESPIMKMVGDIESEIIVLLMKNGTIGMFNPVNKKFEIIVRGMNGKIVDSDYSTSMGTIITIATDYTIKIWEDNNLSQIAQFDYSDENACSLICHPNGPFCAVGFHNGLLRIFDIANFSLVQEISISECPLNVVRYTSDGKLLAIQDYEGTVFILTSPNYQIIKSIEIENINPFHIDLIFSNLREEILITGSFSNKIQIRDTKAYEMVSMIDLEGDLIVKMQFAKNEEELVVLTASSNLIIFKNKINLESTYQQIKKYSKIHEGQCTSFTLGPGFKEIFTGGRNCQIYCRIYESAQKNKNEFIESYLGHITHIKKLFFSADFKTLFSFGDDSNIYSWKIQGEDKDAQLFSSPSKSPSKLIENRYENQAQNAEETLTRSNQNMLENPIIPKDEGQFEASPWKKTLKKTREVFKVEEQKIIRPVRSYITGINCTDRDSIIWIKDFKFVAWTSLNKIVIQELGKTPKQFVCYTTENILTGIKASPDSKFFLTYSEDKQKCMGSQLYVFESENTNCISEFNLNLPMIVYADFSPYSNMVLVISRNDKVSEISLWDYNNTQQLLYEELNLIIQCGKWNLNCSLLQFVACSKSSFRIYNITKDLNFNVIDGTIPPEYNCSITSASFTMAHKNLDCPALILGLSDGHLIFYDSQLFILGCSIKYSDAPIIYIQPGFQRINILAESRLLSSVVFNPKNMIKVGELGEIFLYQKEIQKIEAKAVGLDFEPLGNEGFALSNRGTIWFVNWKEKSAAKIFDHIESNKEIKAMDGKSYKLLENKEKQYICAYTEEGNLKIWDQESRELIMKIEVESYECHSLSFHFTKQILACNFSDGYVRFIDLQNAISLGRVKIYKNKSLSEFQFGHKIDFAYTLSSEGDVDECYIEKWNPITISVKPLFHFSLIGFSLKVSVLDHSIMTLGSNGKMAVFSEKKLGSNNKGDALTNIGKYTITDQFNIEDFVINGCNEYKVDKTLNGFYCKKDRLLPKNVSESKNTCVGCFHCTESNLIFCCIRSHNYLFLRDIYFHQIIQKIELSSPPSTISPNYSRELIAIGTLRGSIIIFDAKEKKKTSEVNIINDQRISIINWINSSKLISSCGGEITEWNVE